MSFTRKHFMSLLNSADWEIKHREFNIFHTQKRRVRVSNKRIRTKSYTFLYNMELNFKTCFFHMPI